MSDLFVLQGALNPSTVHLAMTSLAPVGHAAGTFRRILRLLPAMRHHAEILQADDPGFGYDADDLPSRQSGREMRGSIAASSLARGLWEIIHRRKRSAHPCEHHSGGHDGR
jgi:hypothetical protein